MFCPSCGTESTGLNYCNRCGANLVNALASPPAPIVVNVTKPILIVSLTLLFLTLGGFAGLISGAVGLAHSGLRDDPVVALIFMGMVTIMIADIFLVRQLSRLISASLSHPQPQQPALPSRFVASMPQMTQPTPVRLPAGASVTENTTRFFESETVPVEIPPNTEKIER